MSIVFLTATAADQAAAAQKFGLIPALNEGGPISWSIFIVMVIMSVFSFYIMFTKLIEQQKVLKQAREVRANFWRAGTLEEGAAKLDKNSAFRQLVDDGIDAQKKHSLLTDPVEAHDWLHGAMTRSEESINNKLASGLPFLATVGATAPFVGLLGTVIGIYSALIKIGIAGQADIGKIAGPVGEALIMTAIGLFVAVPAVLAYNWLQARNKTIARELSTFSNNVLGYITSDGKLKPAVAAAAARPAAAPAAAAVKK
jgi:biopolymer transport protein ExbB